MGRFIARVLLAALKSETVQSAAREVGGQVARKATRFLFRKLLAGSRSLNDDSKGRHHSNPAF